MARKNEFTEAVDKAIALRIEDLRVAKGLSNQKIAKQIGVTHQQFGKYTKGTNRISAGRLAAIAKAFGVSVSYLYGLEEDKEINEIVRNYMRIKEPAHQFAVNQLVKTLAN